MSEIGLEQINAGAEHYRMTIGIAEDKYYTEIKNTVRTVINNENIRVIMLAGPSCSGKTTTANILKDEFILSGHPCAVISLDDFYRNCDDPDYPLNEDGNRNLECVEALKIEDIKECIRGIIAGAADVPKFDFITGKRKSETVHLNVPLNGIVIIEGLHALNPVITEGIPKNLIFKIFVSVSTNINYRGRRIISGRKIRFLRRISRDYIYRGSSADRTLNLWFDVLKGEDLYLYPYKNTADLKLDTFHKFEPGVLKGFALNVLKNRTVKNDFTENIYSALEKIKDIPPEAVPFDSLIMEFIPGGKYENIYK